MSNIKIAKVINYGDYRHLRGIDLEMIDRLNLLYDISVNSRRACKDNKEMIDNMINTIENQSKVIDHLVDAVRDLTDAVNYLTTNAETS